MAYKDSGEVSGQSYQLGEYVFSITISHDPGERETGIVVRCDRGDERARVASEVTGTVKSWRVEANETEASVYVLVEKDIPGGGTIPTPIPSSSGGSMTRQEGSYHTTAVNGGVLTYRSNSVGTDIWTFMAASDHAGASVERTTSGGTHATYSLNSTYTFNGKTVYYTIQSGNPYGNPIVGVSPSYDGPLSGQSAWLMLYGDDRETYEKLVARFAIDNRKAGGGPEDSYEDPDDWGDWDDPEDYDPEEDPIEWGDPDYPDPDDPDYPEPIEPGEPGYPDPDDPDYPGEGEDYHPPYEPPQKTLHLTVIGATAGTHIADNIPLPNEQEADYGCGGFGGYGGGGGAGASTVIIHKFATSKANNKELIAIARPHGYGSGGGKGGKGGDGCILIYW